MSRNAILAHIRLATIGPPQPAPHTAAPASLISSGAAAVTRFQIAAKAKGVELIELESLDALPPAIAQAVPGARHVRTNDPAFAYLPWAKAGLTVLSGAADPSDTLTLSRACAAVAETGTVVLASSPQNPAALAFLPATHLVAVARSAIAGNFEEAVGPLLQGSGGGLPRIVNFVSGASRTGDIGGRIVQGAHGPRRLVVFIT